MPESVLRLFLFKMAGDLIPIDMIVAHGCLAPFFGGGGKT
jgi:hypothetical protein